MPGVVITIVLELLQLTGPDGQHVEVNPAEIVTLREVTKNEHFAPGTKCLIHTSDGKFVAVQETCEKVHEQLDSTNQ
jgi:hypothetical protein